MVNTTFITRATRAKMLEKKKKERKLPRTRTDQGRNCDWELSRRKPMCYAKQSKGKAGELNKKR